MPSPLVTPTPAVRTRDLSVNFGTGRVLDGITLHIEDGEAVALLGANGSGKTTLLKALLGLVPLEHGTAELYGVDVARRRLLPWDRVGYVPQRVGFTSGVPATAAEVVASGLLSNRRLRPVAQSRRRILAALEQVGLAGRAGERVHTFSGGQQQRVLMARALVRRPDVLLIDEPLAGLDVESRESLAGTLSALRRAGSTLLIVLHELGELEPVITRSVILQRGRMVHERVAVSSPDGQW